MAELQHTISGIMTGVLLFTFIGICIWSWSGKRKTAFEQMANLPLEQDNDANQASKDKSEASL